MSVVLIGTLDTKGVEFQFVREYLEALGLDSRAPNLNEARAFFRSENCAIAPDQVDRAFEFPAVYGDLDQIAVEQFSNRTAGQRFG